MRNTDYTEYQVLPTNTPSQAEARGIGLYANENRIHVF